MQTLLGFFLAMSITIMLIWVLMRWAVPLGLIDLPSGRKVHSAPVPRVGGIAMVIGILVPLLLWGGSSPSDWALLGGILILLIFGAWDDRKALSWGPKFAGQALAVLVAMLWGGVKVASVTLADRTPLPEWVALPLTFFFLLGGTNAFNLADGLDGLAGGMAMLCLSGTALMAFTVGTPVVGGAAIIMVGAIIGFLRFNTYPAQVFMGDAGSQTLGYCAAVLAVLLTQDAQTPLSTALPLLLLGLPIIDTLMVMVARLLARESPFVADRRHIHHRLLAIGFEHWEAVSILYLLQTGLFVAAWFMRYASDLAVTAVFVAFAVAVLLTIHLVQRFGLRVRAMPARYRDAAVAVSARGPDAALHSAARAVLAGVLVLCGAGVVRYGAKPSVDLGVMAAVLAVALLLGLLLRRHQAEISWVDRLALYSSAALAIYLGGQNLPPSPYPSLLECSVFPLLAVAAVVCIRTARDRPFRITPLDVMVLLLVITVPNLPDSAAYARTMGLRLAELVLLLYAVEALSFAVRGHWHWLSGAAATFLLGLVLRSIW